MRRLEEIEIKKELASLSDEQKDKKALVADEKLQWKAIGGEIAELRKEYAHAPIGKRRTEIGEPPAEIEVAALEALVEREPVTVLCSAKGWIRAAKGHGLAHGDFKYKEGDEERFVLETTTADKLLIFASNGRFYTLDAGKLPSARGHGEPVRLMIELEGEHDLVAVMAVQAGPEIIAGGERRPRLRRAGGRGGGANPQRQAGAESGRNDKGGGAKAVACVPAEGDTVAVVGDNHKLLIFRSTEIARNVARPRRDAATLSRRRPRRREGDQSGGRLELAQRRAHPHRDGLRQLARRPRERGPDGAARIPERE